MARMVGEFQIFFSVSRIWSPPTVKRPMLVASEGLLIHKDNFVPEVFKIIVSAGKMQI